MNTRSVLIATVVALASGAALADDPTPEPTDFRAMRSRGEVKAEVRVARAEQRLIAAGELLPAASERHQPVVARSTVKADVVAAAAAGTLARAGELADVQNRPARRIDASTTLARR